MGARADLFGLGGVGAPRLDLDIFTKKKQRLFLGFPSAFPGVRVVCVRRGRVGVIMVMVMVVVMVRVLILHLEPAKTGAAGIAELAISHGGDRRRGAMAFDIVVITFPNCANVTLKPQNRTAIFAYRACGRRHCA